MKPLKRISTTWSRELAYCIGLISSDGNLSKDGRHIIFVSKDLDLINVFCKCLCINPKIGMKGGGYGDKFSTYFVQFSDVNFYRFLILIGLTPAKSKTIGMLGIPAKFFPDFLRGSFDGDGTFYSYWDKRWRSSYMYYLCFISASIEHLVWIREVLSKRLNIKGHLNPKSNQRVFQLRYSKHEARKVINLIYKNSNIPRLERKYIKVYNALAIDEKNNSARVL